MNQIIFGTGNKNKLEEVESILGRKVLGYTQHDLDIISTLPDGDIPEIQSMDIRTIVEQKAKAVFDALKKPIVVEDTGFYIKSLNGFPGPLVKYAINQIGNQGILKLMKGVSDRTAIAVTGVCLYDGKDYILGYGEVEGTVTEEEKLGDREVFGYDSIFQANGQNQTFAEMSAEDKNQISMRKLAFEDFLRNYDNSNN